MKNHTKLPKPKWQSFCKCQRERRTKETNKYCNSFPFCSQTNWYLFIFLKIVTKIRLTYISSECVRLCLEYPLKSIPPQTITLPSLSLSHTLTCTWARRLTASHAISAAMATRPRAGESRRREREWVRAPAFNVNATAGERGRAQSLALRKWEGESALQKELHIMLDNFRTKCCWSFAKGLKKTRRQQYYINLWRANYIYSK